MGQSDPSNGSLLPLPTMRRSSQEDIIAAARPGLFAEFKRLEGRGTVVLPRIVGIEAILNLFDGYYRCSASTSAVIPLE